MDVFLISIPLTGEPGSHHAEAAGWAVPSGGMQLGARGVGDGYDGRALEGWVRAPCSQDIWTSSFCLLLGHGVLQVGSCS